MSKYSKMQAPPFWMGMFKIVGILCLITLVTPALYLAKYALHDNPLEQKMSAALAASPAAIARPAFIGGVDWYIQSTGSNNNSAVRKLAVKRLGELAGSTKTQIFYPMECLNAKLALEQVASADPDPRVRAEAQSTLMSVAQHGAVIQR